jgi:hypothetical protein
MEVNVTRYIRWNKTMSWSAMTDPSSQGERLFHCRHMCTHSPYEPPVLWPSLLSYCAHTQLSQDSDPSLELFQYMRTFRVSVENFAVHCEVCTGQKGLQQCDNNTVCEHTYNADCLPAPDWYLSIAGRRSPPARQGRFSPKIELTW